MSWGSQRFVREVCSGEVSNDLIKIQDFGSKCSVISLCDFEHTFAMAMLVFAAFVLGDWSDY